MFASQQSLNLLQAGHNTLHEAMGKIDTGRLPQSSKDRRILDAKNSLPLKFSGKESGQDPVWRVFAKKSRSYVSRTFPEMKNIMKEAEKLQTPISDISAIGLTTSQDDQLGEY